MAHPQVSRPGLYLYPGTLPIPGVGGSQATTPSSLCSHPVLPLTSPSHEAGTLAAPARCLAQSWGALCCSQAVCEGQSVLPRATCQPAHLILK